MIIKKMVTIQIILLFIGVAFVPSINASVVEDELVEFDVEFCGLGKKHTVKLTQQEADEVELLFDDIEQQLSDVETREEAEEIFKDAVVELDRCGLLGGLSLKYAQNLVTGKYNEKSNNGIQKKNPSNNDLYNSNCMVLGTNLDNTHFFASNQIQSKFMDIYLKLTYKIPLLTALLAILTLFIFNIKPIHFNCDVAFGYMSIVPPLYHRVYPASGTIYTRGDEGVKSLSGEFFGLFELTGFRTGMIGFTGLKILNNFIGFAKEVELKEYWNH